MRVAVTGGTGFVGRAVTEELLRRGHAVRVLARKRPEALSGRQEAEFVPGDVVSGEGLEELTEGAEALVHLVGIIRPAGRNTFDAVHRGGTVNALAAAARKGVGRFLHMSALGTRAGAEAEYHRSKWKGEEAVRGSSLTWTIFRPSLIYGPGDEFVNMLARVMRRSPVMPLFGGGHTLFQPIAVWDVARAFTAALEEAGTAGKLFELGGRDILTFRDLLRAIAKALGKNPLLLPVPFGVVDASLALLQGLGLRLPLTRDQLLMLREDNVRRGGEELEVLGLTLPPFEEGIRTYLR